MERLICLAVGYAFGLFQTSFIYGKMKGIDIRSHGSGNAGTTNSLRVLGKKAGFIVLVGDILKCMAAIAVVKFVFKENYAQELPLLQLYAGAGAILGHNFPFYLRFKGGKGIAATAGLILSMPWPFFAVEAPLFFLAFFITHYVSLGSLLVYAGFMTELVIYGQLGYFHMSQPLLLEMYGVGMFLTIMAFWKHRANIVRLLKGEERKTYLKKKNTEA